MNNETWIRDIETKSVLMCHDIKQDHLSMVIRWHELALKRIDLFCKGLYLDSPFNTFDFYELRANMWGTIINLKKMQKTNANENHSHSQ